MFVEKLQTVEKHTFGFLGRLYFCLDAFDEGPTCKVLSGSLPFEEHVEKMSKIKTVKHK